MKYYTINISTPDPYIAREIAEMLLPLYKGSGRVIMRGALTQLNDDKQAEIHISDSPMAIPRMAKIKVEQ